MFTIISYIFIILLAALSVFHVGSCIGTKRRAVAVSKPFLMPLVILFYIASTVTPSWLLIVALFCGLGGDVFLIFRKTSQKAMMLGLACFLIGHVFDFILFASTTSWFATASPFALLIAIPYAFYGIAMFRVLKDDSGTMKVPTAVYLLVILLASIVASTRWPSTSPISFWLVLVGTWSFIASDSLLAIEYFKKKPVWNHGLVMITYIVAQFLIATGFLL